MIDLTYECFAPTPHNHNNPPTRPMQASVKRDGEVGPAGALPSEVSLATLCALLTTGVEPVPASLDADSIDAVVDTPVEDTADEAVNAPSEERGSLLVDEAVAVLATPVTLPAVSIARYVGNAKPLPGGYCVVCSPEQQS
jgi:hypothetical protein